MKVLAATFLQKYNFEGLEKGFPGSSGGRVCLQCGRPVSDPGSGRSPGEGNGNLLQYSWLENPMDRGNWQAIVHGVTKSHKQMREMRQQVKMVSLMLNPKLRPDDSFSSPRNGILTSQG